MVDVAAYIESGIIQQYVLGTASIEEMEEVQTLAEQNPAIKAAIDKFSFELEEFALANAVAPDPTIKPMVMATIDFISRMEKGEQPSNPPLLSVNSKINDYSEWLNRPDLNDHQQKDDVFARIISFSPEATTAIVWLKDMAPLEVHHNEYERFLIVEGTCEITVGDKIHSLSPGNYFQIPLHAHHSIKVTSSISCKVILQRVAA